MRKIFFIAFLFFNHAVVAQINQAKEILKRMINATEYLRSSKFTLYCEERLRNGEFAVSERIVKFQRKPRQIYLYCVKPNAGTEILWKDGWNENKMLIGPKNFPFVTFSSKINSSIARKDTHHSVSDLGFDYLAGLIQYYIKTNGEKFYDDVVVGDTVQWNNHSCIILKLRNKDYREAGYTIKRGENLVTIAEKLHVNDFAILALNPSVKDFDDVKEGQVIIVPNFYGMTFEFYIDRATWLPLRQVISDKKGVFEKYEMKSFILNPAFKPDEFSTENKNYKF